MMEEGRGDGRAAVKRLVLRLRPIKASIQAKKGGTESDRALHSAVLGRLLRLRSSLVHQTNVAQLKQGTKLMNPSCRNLLRESRQILLWFRFVFNLISGSISECNHLPVSSPAGYCCRLFRDLAR